ncbi:MAG: hypothetical protein AAF518_15215 [Spirochaetota bacterium]
MTFTSKPIMADINGIIITGSITILGTVVGSVLKGYWSTRLAEKDFQSKLILKAMESEDAKVRAKSLEFLTKVNLIDDKKISKGVRKILASGELDLIPQFKHSGDIHQANTTSTGVTEIQSAKEQLLQKQKDAHQDNFLALVGFVVRSGDIIDGLMPIFAEIGIEDKQFKSKHTGKLFGGSGGSPTELYHQGYVVTGIDIIRGHYFGREEVAHLQIIWHRLTPQGIDKQDEIVSDKLGSGNYITYDESIPTRKFRAQAEHYITDFAAKQSYHTDGSTFLHDMEIKEEPFPG